MRFKEFFVDNRGPDSGDPDWGGPDGERSDGGPEGGGPDSKASNRRGPAWFRKPPSRFTPHKNRETNLDSYLDLISSETIKLLKTKNDLNSQNLNETQREALEKLIKDKDIVCKPADKGGLLIVID
jgi:hypothetical protein